MATLVLQAAGAYLGGFFGAVGSAIGTAYGGYLLDQSLINSTRHIKGQRLSSPQALTGEDGAPLPRIFGTVRQGGTLMWATHFEESSKTERQGSKGSGPKVTSYSYYANFAVAICEGEISHVRRIWVDGKELDLNEHTVRIYKGSNAQLPDPLIEAKQGIGNTPAYRGTAYAVFDRFSLANYGNRIPQVQFEVIRVQGSIAKDIKAITIIPGSTEFGLSPVEITQSVRAGETLSLNRNILYAGSDWEASLDELQALCPNLERVALVVSWFGDDLRAGNCKITPRVSMAIPYKDDAWKVSNLTRGTAKVVSQHDGKAAFGGTPDDKSVIFAIQDLKKRGLKVTLYPFILMDIPSNNSLPSPYGGVTQSAYPWRGEISCSPALGVSGSVDATVTAVQQVANFSGTASINSFNITGGNVVYSGSQDWGYRRFILHYAHLAKLAGGVDAFLIGSEFKGLTRVRGGGGFPFVSILSSLATDIRTVLGPSVKLTYAADWSEYSAYTPPNSSDLYFNLDPLWANSAINSVGIDNYMPLSDWRDEDWNGNNPDGFSVPNDLEKLKNAIKSGEGYDWFYANDLNREMRVRSPIIDGEFDKNWVYRFKDIRGWWENLHYERINGVEKSTPTAWIPQSKPVWFTELGCAAIDKASNQPNVFLDPKSASSARPYFSNQGRDDQAQARFLAAHLEFWSDPVNNPISLKYPSSMLDLEHNYIWAWDARPFPAFPLHTQTWGDGDNWLTGHWLNGRLSSLSLQDLISNILIQHGIIDFNTFNVDGTLVGYKLDKPSSVRDDLDALLALFRVDVFEKGGTLHFISRDRALGNASLISSLAFNRQQGVIERSFESSNHVAGELCLEYRDGMLDYQQVSVKSKLNQKSNGSETLSLPAILENSEAEAQLRQFHRQQSVARNRVTFTSGLADIALQPGDLITIEEGGERYQIKKITDTFQREYEADVILPPSQLVRRTKTQSYPQPVSQVSGPPLGVFLDLPLLQPEDPQDSGLRFAAWSKPWSPVVVLASPADDSYMQKLIVDKPAFVGTLASPLKSGVAGRVSTNDWFEVTLYEGSLVSIVDLFLFNGANVAAVQNANGDWEVLQFGRATELSAGRWRLERLIRGQAGTTDAMAIGASVGAQFVLLDNSVKRCGLTETEKSLDLNWKIGPANKALSNKYYAVQPVPMAKRYALANAPVHLCMKKMQNGDAFFSWKRCGTLNADRWDMSEIPLVEKTESYQVIIFGIDQSARRKITVETNSWIYSFSEQNTDFGVIPTDYIIKVAQISANGMSGVPRTLNVIQ
jgi:hypothetical protein